MSSSVLSGFGDPAPVRDAPAAVGDFPAEDLRRPTWQQKLVWWFLDRPRWLKAAIWVARPFARLGNKAVVTGHDAVRAVLSDGKAFPVPFRKSFEAMNGGGLNSVLGMDDDDHYRAINAEMVRALRLSDAPRIAEIARAKAEELVAEAAPKGEIDAMSGLLILVPVRVVEEYYGVPAEGTDLHLWSMAMSAYAFAGPFANGTDKAMGVAGGRLLREAVQRAIDEAERRGGDDGTVLGRLVRARRDGAEVLTPDVLRVTVVGLITGFVPTSIKASGQILKKLLRHPDMLQAAEAAARSGDDDLLRRCLFEALRFAPTVPIIFRRCAAESVLPGGQRVRPGMDVMTVAMLAAFDGARVQRPWRFDPARGEGDSLGFGFGQHRCVGAALAGTQITAAFKPLLLRGGLREAPQGRRDPSYFASFMEHKHVALGERAKP